MTVQRHTPPGTLFDRIIDGLVNAGTLTPALVDYIDRALFPIDPDQLAAFIDDDEDPERDSLLDLIFFPDLSFQIALEPLLAATPCSATDERLLNARLWHRRIDVPLTLPDGRSVSVIRIPDFVKSHYTARLRLTWRMDPQVAAAIESGVAAAMTPVVRVHLRNGRVRFSDGQRLFLTRFFERMPDTAPDYLDCLDLTLPLVENAAGEAELYERLVTHKRDLFRSLQQARRFETLRQTANMETLMLQGVRAAHASGDDLQERMRLIDRVCLGLFGRSEPLQPPVAEPLRQVSDLDHPAAAVQALWR